MKPNPLSIALLLTISAFAHAGTTHWDLQKVKLEVNRKTLGEAYKQVGQRNEKWDAAAIEFLDRIAIRFSEAGVSRFYVSGIDTSAEALLPLADKAIAAGCDDPLVLYCKAVILHDGDQNAEAVRLMNHLLPRLLDSAYPARRKHASANRYLKFKDGFDPALQKRAENDSRKYLFDQLAAPLIDPVERRMRYELAVEWWTPLDMKAKQKFIDELAATPNLDPWVRDMMLGEHEIALAWDARGGGWASTVTPEGWEGMHKHLKQAHEKLVLAHELEPDYPEASTNMITVAMGDGGRLDEGTRNWFDAAIRAQIDWTPAWTTYSYSLLPRWGGSHDQMFALAREAADTKRYDLSVPNTASLIIEQIARDAGSDLVFRRADAWPMLEQMLDGYLASAGKRIDAPYTKSRKAVYAYRAGKWDAAAAVLKDLGDNVAAQAFVADGLDFTDVRNTCAALTSDQAPSLTRAVRLESSGMSGAAISIYEQVLKTVPEGHVATDFASVHLENCRILHGLQRGDVVTLNLRNPKDLLNFRAEETPWTLAAPGELLFTADKPTAGHFNHRVVFKGDLTSSFEFMWGGKKEAAPLIGLVFQDLEHEAQRVAVAVNPSKQAVQLSTKKWTFVRAKEQIELPADQWHRVEVRRRSGTVTVLINEKVAIDGFENEWFTRGKPILGLFARVYEPGQTVRLRNVQVSRPE